MLLPWPAPVVAVVVMRIQAARPVRGAPAVEAVGPPVVTERGPTREEAEPRSARVEPPEMEVAQSLAPHSRAGGVQ